jgi:hypothetical protein
MRKFLIAVSLISLAAGAGAKRVLASPASIGACHTFCPPGDDSFCGGLCDKCLSNCGSGGCTHACGPQF